MTDSGSKKERRKATPGSQLEQRIQKLQGEVKDLRDSQRSLTEELEQYVLLLDDANDIIYTHDASGQFLSSNAAVERILGYSQAEVQNLNIRDILPPESLQRAQESIAMKLSGTARTAPYEIRVLRKDGSDVWLEVNTRVLTEGAEIKAIQGIGRDVTQRRAMDDLVRHQAFHDPLTLLPNRRLFFDRLEVAASHAKRLGERVAVFFLDVDRFKPVNDGLGHDVGDLLLKGIANRLQAAMRDCDTVSRLGGDEFALFIPHLSRANDAARFARRIIKAFDDPYVCSGHRVFVTPSIGISLFPDDGESSEALLRHADMAMYRAKGQGGNGFHFFHEDMNREVHRKMTLENALRLAIDREDLMLRFQPRVSFTDHETAALESTVQLPGTLSDLVSSDDIIAFAAETGLIIPIGKWLLENTVRQIRTWMDAGLPAVPVALKITSRQFQHSPIVDNVRGTLEEFDVPAHQILLELVDTYERIDRDLVALKFNRLRELGVTVSVDYFSQRRTSLVSFHGATSDYVVIGGGLTTDVMKNARSAAITQALIGLAQQLGVITVAQGVQNAVQALWLQEAGCDLGQGVHFGEPMDADAVAAHLQSNPREPDDS